MSDYDVIIVGGGGAGIAAAIEALDAGAKVLLCEAAQRLGGSAANSGGVIMAAGSALQQAQGIDDCVDDLYNYYMTVNLHEVEPALAHKLCAGGVPTIEWLQSFGVTFSAHGLYITGIENPKTPRGHTADGNGYTIMEKLSQAAMAKGLEVALKTRVEQLIVEHGKVCGIRAAGAEVRAPAVIIATGGFGNNLDMLQHYFPDAARHGKDWHFYVGIDENKGDGLKMGLDAGAAVVGEGGGQSIITPIFSKEVEPYIPGWLVYVNKKGFRFIDETAPYVVMDHVVYDQPDGVCFAIMDHAAFAREENDPKYKTREFLVFPTPNWTPEMLAEHQKNGKIHKADTLEDLGRQAGIAPEALAATMDEYNRDAARGHDRHYLKNKTYLLPMTQGPYYAIELRATAVGTTHTGLRVNLDAEVIGTNGRRIPGLYCAGECAGGIMKHYAGGGNSLLNCFVYGRTAGRNATTAARRNPD